jgi:PEP-CTERM motif-containing protein
MASIRVLGLSVLLGLAAWQARAATIDFEGLADSTSVSNQYAGLTFANAVIWTAGISLNEFELPPHSGSNVVLDDGAPISIAFATPILNFSAYFTYAVPLSLEAFDAGLNSVAFTNSIFSNNLALSGDPGTSPNDFLQLAFAGGISKVTITGDPFGFSLAMDDVSYTSAATAVPEPSTFPVLLVGAVGLLARRWRLYRIRS